MGFGDRLKKLRKERKITQAELSRLSGLSQSAISAFEIGINEPTAVSIQQLSRALGIAPGDLLGDAQDKPVLEDSLTAQERQLLSVYRALTPQGREYIRQQLDIARRLYSGDAYLSNVENG